MSRKKMLILFLVGDNHISNVKTLQSIYRQDYPNICLVVCNDCTDRFQSERLLYNFQAGRPEGVKQIVFHENPHPMGEYLSQRQIWEAFDAEYIFTVHGGEYLLSSNALTRCVNHLESNDALAAVVTSVELWSDDMKKMCARQSMVRGKMDKARLLTEEQPAMDELRDCMLMCRLKVVRELALEEGEGQRLVSQTILSALLAGKELVLALPFSACRFSKASIVNPRASIPATYGNEQLQKIGALLESCPDNQRGMFIQGEATRNKARKRNLALYKYSRRVAFKWYALAMLLLLACAAFLLFDESRVRVAAAGVVIVIACIVAVWTAAMLLVNIYFKKNPQRLGL